ncbi:MAG: hypothetical protein QOI32_606, partial [Thermoleophilaceae bacterium]|nr:hypothetical protein [Thermoleophilaceae bacterium]
ELAATGAVDSVDFKSFYTGTPVDVETDPELYQMVIEAFPNAWIEDPDVTDETRPILDPVSDRVTWDAPIHSVADVLEREPRPLNFVVSMRLGAWEQEGPETPDKALRLLERYPGTKLKLDPTNNWTPELVETLVATGAVDSVDLKGQYKGTPVDVETDPELYRMVIEAFPNAWLEDPDVTDATRPILDAVSDRVTWDAPIHSVADVLDRPWRPRMVNIKPSRFGPLSNLFEMYDWCEREGVQAYGGGQTELGPGRGHIQYLASLFHPDTPNDTAPSGYNEPNLPDGLPTSPLEPRIAPSGFRWQQ